MTILSITENVLTYISGFGIIQGILLSAVIYFHPRSDRTVNIFLSLYILSITVVMTIPFTMKLIHWQNSYYIQAVPLLPSIFILFYFRGFKETITWRKIWPHFIPVLIFFIFSYLNLSHWKKVYPEAEQVPVEVLKNPVTLFVLFFRTAQQFIYYFLARRVLISYRHSIHHLFSETSRIEMRWAKFLVNGYAVLISTFLFVFPLMLNFPAYIDELMLFNMTIATPYIYMATYKGAIQVTIWQLKPGMNKETVEQELKQAEEAEREWKEDEKSSTARITTDPERMTEVAQKINNLMEQEKIYQEPELTLQQLAEKLDLPSYQASQAINDGLKKNFYDLVNGYRVEEAKRLLLDDKNRNYTILSVGFEAGFNSKTTFNTVFKKFTGQTPTEFRNKQNRPVLSAG